jgi:Ala-tRNA(Pro) deacylase
MPASLESTGKLIVGYTEGMRNNNVNGKLHIAAEPGRRLSIGTMPENPPKSSDDLFGRFRELGITHKTYQHQQLFTVEQSKAQRGILDGSHIKNLFLRDKKRRMWLVTVDEERVVNLKALRHRLGAQGNLSFGRPELLMDALGVAPGAVTPFAIINDREGLVTLVLDQAILRQDPLNAHPLRNDMTTVIAARDLLNFAAAEAHTPIILDFGDPD